MRLRKGFFIYMYPLQAWFFISFILLHSFYSYFGPMCGARVYLVCFQILDLVWAPGWREVRDAIVQAGGNSIMPAPSRRKHKQ